MAPHPKRGAATPTQARWQRGQAGSRLPPVAVGDRRTARPPPPTALRQRGSQSGPAGENKGKPATGDGRESRRRAHARHGRTQPTERRHAATRRRQRRPQHQRPRHPQAAERQAPTTRRAEGLREDLDAHTSRVRNAPCTQARRPGVHKGRGRANAKESSAFADRASPRPSRRL